MSTPIKFYYKQKYLSTFIDRFVPSFWKQQYPNMWVFIKYFLQFLEEKNNTYDLINNFTNLVDIDYINSITDENLKESLMNNIYSQYLGDENARFLSTLLDDVLYIKYQKELNGQKGTKANLMFFFLIILNGFFNVENITSENKKHDMTYKHDATVSYNRAEELIEPFKYLIKSEFTYNQYSTVLDTLNPAGVLPIPLFERQQGVYYFDDKITDWGEPHRVYSDNTIEDLVDLDNKFYYILFYGEECSECGDSGTDVLKTGLKVISKVFTANILEEIKAYETEDFYLQNGLKYKNIDITDVGSSEYIVKMDTSFGSNILITNNLDTEEIKYIKVVESNHQLNDDYYCYNPLSMASSIEDLENETGFDWSDLTEVVYDNSPYSLPNATGGHELLALNFNNKKDINNNVFKYYITSKTNRINISVMIYKG